MAKLIILDLFGTLVKADVPDNQIRPGFQEFWEHYKREGRLFVVCSDGSQEGVESVLSSTGLLDKLNGVYDARHLEGYTGESLKDVARICEDFGIHTSDTVFIGDDYHEKDSCSAYCARVPFVRVPQFRDRLPDAERIRINGRSVIYEIPGNPFSFKQLIGAI